MARRQRTPEGVTAPDEEKALKGRELHERSYLKRVGRRCEEQRVERVETLRTQRTG
jgi:hypothetical protein